MEVNAFQPRSICRKSPVLLRSADRVGDERDGQGAVVDPVAEGLALGSQAVEIGLAFRQGVFGLDQRLGSLASRMIAKSRSTEVCSALIRASRSTR